MTRISTDQAVALAIEHQQSGRLKEAESLCRQVLSINSNHGGALHLLGMLALATGQPGAALQLVGRAAAASPDRALYHADLGRILETGGQPFVAIEAYRRAIQLQPDFYTALCNLGGALRTVGKLKESIAASSQAIALKPDLAEAYGNLGNALSAGGQQNEAIAAYQMAIRLRPDMAISHYNLASAYQKKGDLDEAVAAYREAIRIHPGFAEAYSNLGNALQNIGQLDEAIAACRKAVELNPGLAEAQGNVIFTLHFHPAYDPPAIQAELRKWNARHAEPLKKFMQPHLNIPDSERRLRIGYVSDDFYNHASALFLLPLFRNHDRRQFEVHCYSQHAHTDENTRQMQEQVHQWRSIVGRSDSEAAGVIRDEKIDILVDLKLHTASNRLLVFALKPAPVQVTWLGYPGSTGMDAIDYRLTDPYIDPSELDDEFYSEQSVRLPDTFWCYDPLCEGIEVSELPCIANNYLTFGCLNTLRKMNDRVVAAWARILNEVPGSRLMMMAPEGDARRTMLERLGAEGIISDKVQFVPRQSRLDYLRTYQKMDIGLDTFPYNGHTTSLDSFWMGVPVVTLSGKTAVGRAGVSQLTNLGMTELIGNSVEEYVQIARDLSRDIARLREIRKSLRPRMEASPLMDAPRFVRNVETAYRDMWRHWCETRTVS